MRLVKTVLKNEKGISLVELLAVATVGSLLLMGVMSLMFQINRVTQRQKLELNSQQTANLIISELTNKIKNNHTLDNVENNDTKEITLAFSDGTKSDYLVYGKSNRLKVESTLINSSDPMFKPTIGFEGYRENNTVVYHLKVEFFDEKNKLIYDRATEVAAYETDSDRGWW